MSDVGFVVAGYAVILGGLALYVASLLRRLTGARRALERNSELVDEEAG